ncbi:MAG: hypothetical protein DRN81_06960 [Thermoproteota archaeon]|nr:MAG: hypothetical protein DRN81_06960 [Candidatus Korarchaeota archaeon]
MLDYHISIPYVQSTAVLLGRFVTVNQVVEQPGLASGDVNAASGEVSHVAVDAVVLDDGVTASDVNSCAVASAAIADVEAFDYGGYARGDAYDLSLAVPIQDGGVNFGQGDCPTEGASGSIAALEGEGLGDDEDIAISICIGVNTLGHLNRPTFGHGIYCLLHVLAGAGDADGYHAAALGTTAAPLRGGTGLLLRDGSRMAPQRG